MKILKNVLLSTRRSNRRTIINLFQELKLELNFYNSISLLTPPLKQGKNKTIFSPDTTQAHPSYTEHFLYVNVGNCAAQFQISWPAMAMKHQWRSHA